MCCVLSVTLEFCFKSYSHNGDEIQLEIVDSLAL
jgi:hypothetical protein